MQKARKIIYTIGLFILVIAFSNLWFIKHSTEKSKNLYDDLASKAKYQRQQSEKRDMTCDESSQTDSSDNTDFQQVSEDVLAGEERRVLNGWIKDMEKDNEDTKGWIVIPETKIDYPVMQTDEDDDFYLTHDFSKRWEYHGAPFIDVNCDIENCDNIIIYGHNMRDESMFGNLEKFKKKKFCEKNRFFDFYTVENTDKYEICCVMVISANEAKKFPYYTYSDFKNEESFIEFTEGIKKYSVWESNTKLEYGDKLLTLSTCEYSKNDGRLVVIAKRIERLDVFS